MCSEFYSLQGELSPVCTHEDTAVYGVRAAAIAADGKGPGSSNDLTFHQHWRKSEEDSRISPDLLQWK